MSQHKLQFRHIIVLFMSDFHVTQQLMFDRISVSVFGRKWMVTFGVISVSAETEIPLSVDLYQQCISLPFVGINKCHVMPLAFIYTHSQR